jgi:hypothetical protein
MGDAAKEYRVKPSYQKPRSRPRSPQRNGEPSEPNDDRRIVRVSTTVGASTCVGSSYPGVERPDPSAQVADGFIP